MENVCIIIPAYNESKTIGAVVKGLKANFQHIIVVNDASGDNTSEEAKRSGAIVVDNAENRGYDGALEEGFKKAKEMSMKYGITVDADEQHDLNDVKLFADILLKEKKDLVIGIRPEFARCSEHLMSLYSRIRFQIVDPLCGMKGYNLSFYDKLGHFDSYKSIGTELAFFSVKQKCDFRQIPVSISKRRYGKSQFGTRFTANMKILISLLKSFFKF